MAQWYRAYPLSAAVKLGSTIERTDRIRVTGGGFDVTGRLFRDPQVKRGDIESYAKFQITPLREEEPITETAEKHVVLVDIFENVNRDDVSGITASVRQAGADMADTITEFPVQSLEVIEELHHPELLVNEDFNPSEIDDEEKADRLARVDEMVRTDTPYYAVLHEIGGGEVDEIRWEDAVNDLQQRGYVRETSRGTYELTSRGELMHQAFSDYIYGDPS